MEPKTRLGASKEVERLARSARKHGWTVGITGGNHVKWVSPQGAVVFSGLTMCGPGFKKTIAQLRRAGLNALPSGKVGV